MLEKCCLVICVALSKIKRGRVTNQIMLEWTLQFYDILVMVITCHVKCIRCRNENQLYFFILRNVFLPETNNWRPITRHACAYQGIQFRNDIRFTSGTWGSETLFFIKLFIFMLYFYVLWCFFHGKLYQLCV